MARNRGKKALYEVMSKARVKPGRGKTLEQMSPKKPDEDSPATEQKSAAEMPKTTVRWWRKPRIIQFNSGRIEFSMPYQLGVALLLGLILLLLAAYRFGQSSYPTEQQEAGKVGEETPKIENEQPTERAMTNIMRPSAPPEETLPDTEELEPEKLTGNNVIVLVEYEALADLIPVQEHFGDYDIETEIVTGNGRYFLQTKQMYDNPATPGTDGYEARQKIAEIGAKYKGKAPAGYETFAPNFFSDAYGKKIK
ncbi:MAG: hypothetical protein ACYTFW_02700 [Planctomycetota bacterium]